MIALDPEEVLDVVLKEDLELPEATRPAVLVKAMTCRRERQYRPLIRAASAAEKASDLDGTIDNLIKAIAVVYVGVKNIPGVKEVGDLEDRFTLDELWRIGNGVWEVSSLTRPLEGQSSSPSQLPAANTAKDGATPANAAGAQPSGSPSASA